MTAVTTFDAGKAVMKVTTIEIAIDYLLDMRPPKSKFFGKPFIVDTDELFEKVLDTSVIVRRTGISRTIYGWQIRHISPAPYPLKPSSFHYRRKQMNP